MSPFPTKSKNKIAKYKTLVFMKTERSTHLVNCSSKDIVSCSLVPCRVNSVHALDSVCFQTKSPHPLLWWRAPSVAPARTTEAWRAPLDLSQCTASPMHLLESSAPSEGQQQKWRADSQYLNLWYRIAWHGTEDSIKTSTAYSYLPNWHFTSEFLSIKVHSESFGHKQMTSLGREFTLKH